MATRVFGVAGTMAFKWMPGVSIEINQCFLVYSYGINFLIVQIWTITLFI